MKMKIYSFCVVVVMQMLAASGLQAQNVALGKTAVASSLESGSTPASLAIDKHGTAGEIDPLTGLPLVGGPTRWTSGWSDNEWIYIDLGTLYTVSQVNLYWESASGKDFKIQISSDASAWTDMASITNNSTFVNNIAVSGTGRYVRMLGITRNTGFGYSIWEFEVIGTIVVPLGSNLALGKTAVASSEQFPGVAAPFTVDGQGNASNVDYLGGCSGGAGCSFWASNTGNDNEWIYVDLGASYYLRQVVLYWTFKKANDFKIQVSPDAVTWTDVKTVNGNTAFVSTVNCNQAFGRYVKMQGISRFSDDYELFEFEIYGQLTVLPVKLTAFAARQNKTAVDVSWSASLDRDGDFTVERSVNGRDYTSVGTVHESSGTGGQFRNYRLTDLSPVNGRSYYRLKYGETGTVTKYSNVINVNYNTGLDIQVFPNPVTGKNIIVNLTEAYTGKLEVRIINTTGNTVYHQTHTAASRNQFEISRMASVPAGNYLLQVVTEDGRRLSKMITVQ